MNKKKLGSLVTELESMVYNKDQELAKLRAKVATYESALNGDCVEGEHCRACNNAISYDEHGVWVGNVIARKITKVCCRLKVPCKKFDYKEVTKDGKTEQEETV